MPRTAKENCMLIAPLYIAILQALKRSLNLSLSVEKSCDSDRFCIVYTIHYTAHLAFVSFGNACCKVGYISRDCYDRVSDPWELPVA